MQKIKETNERHFHVPGKVVQHSLSRALAKPRLSSLPAGLAPSRSLRCFARASQSNSKATRNKNKSAVRRRSPAGSNLRGLEKGRASGSGSGCRVAAQSVLDFFPLLRASGMFNTQVPSLAGQPWSWALRLLTTPNETRRGAALLRPNKLSRPLFARPSRQKF